MRIIGCDLHTRQQTVAMLDTTTGAVVEKTLRHESSEVREFYSTLPRPVRVGIEATGSMSWFVNLMDEVGIECQIGHPATIRAAEPRKQKHDRRDADLILKLLDGKSLSGNLAAFERARRFAGLVATPSSMGAHADTSTECFAGDCSGECSRVYGRRVVLRRSRVQVSGWKSGKFNARHPVVLGVRVGQENVRRFFDKNSNVIVVEAGDETIQVNLTKTFWTTCPELRSPGIGAWLRKKRLAPWSKGRPPEMRLTSIGKNRFRFDV